MKHVVEYNVSQVTVFPDRALVTIQGSVPVSPEVNELIFDGLPLSLEQDSLRVAGRGTVPVRILSVDVARHHYEQAPSPKIKALHSQIEEVNEEIGALEDAYATWQAEAEQLNGLRQATTEYARGIARGRMSVQDQQELILYIRAHDQEIRREQRAIALQQRRLQDRAAKLKRELDELRSVQSHQRLQARVVVSITGDGEFSPQLSYGVRNARWAPQYEVHYSDSMAGDGTLLISLKAIVSQQTGQDWENVELTVSTARPALNQRVPELKPWFVDVYEPPRIQPAPHAVRTAKSAMISADASLDLAMAGADESVPVNDAEAVTAVIGESASVTTYQVPGTCDIASDGSPHQFVLSQLSQPFMKRYISVPKHTSAVFRVLTLTNNSGAPFLPGSAALFVDNEYVGRTNLPLTANGGELELLLGVEDRIEVERELIKRTVDKKFLKDQRAILYAYELTFRNWLEQAAHLEVHEHIPVSRHEEIQVKLENAQPPPARHSDMNILEWELDLQPKGEASITYNHSVQYPRSINVVGLID